MRIVPYAVLSHDLRLHAERHENGKVRPDHISRKTSLCNSDHRERISIQLNLFANDCRRERKSPIPVSIAEYNERIRIFLDVIALSEHPSGCSVDSQYRKIVAAHQTPID